MRCPSRVVGSTVPSDRRSTTPKGQPATQVPHPLHTSCCTTTVPNSVRNNAPVGHTSRHPACVQCLHTSDDMSQRNSGVSGGVVSTASGGVASAEVAPPGIVGIPRPTRARPDSRALSMRSRSCSMNATCRHVLAPSATVLSYDMPVSSRSPSRGFWFHSLHATSHALQPIQIDVSVKNPLRGRSASPQCASALGSVGPDS